MILNIVVGSKLPKTLYFSKPMACKKTNKYPGKTLGDTISLQMKYVFMFYPPPPQSVQSRLTSRYFNEQKYFYIVTS